MYSWGRLYKSSATDLKSVDKFCSYIKSAQGSVLPYGLGRSYGDSCLNDGQALISTRSLDNLISFDPDKGQISCQAGMSFAEILDFSVKRGWFLPVTPGTKHVTIGGAIANDVHGKNHHRAGTFGNFVLEIELLRSNGERILCSRTNNEKFFNATIAGLGLTGLIYSVKFQLQKISSELLTTENIPFNTLEEFLAISQSSVDYEYTVAWLDVCAKNSKFGRGIFMRGKHEENDAGLIATSAKKRKTISIPFECPSWLLNNLGISAFNSLYYAINSRKHKMLTHYEPFFYPLDVLDNWNRLYGKRGFFQFQCVVPGDGDVSSIKEILDCVKSSNQASYLAVLKEFGSIESPGMLSFPRKGITICLDFPNKGKSTLDLLHRLDGLVRNLGGAIYPAKDAVMGRESFEAYFPRLKEFEKYKDTGFSSSFWRRVTDS